MQAVTYNIPAHLIPDYRGKNIIIRGTDPGLMVGQLSATELDRLRGLQLLAPPVDAMTLDPLDQWDCAVPLDVLIREPAVEFALLNNLSKLRDKHPVRVTIAVRTGFIRALKLALTLQFAVKLEFGQPDPALIEELNRAVELYFTRPNVMRGVDPFHRLFLSFYGNHPDDLWLIQDEDPEALHFIGDDGVEAISPRFAGIDPRKDPALPDIFTRAPELVGASECNVCEFADRCGGYFKWPDPSFNCSGVKSVLRTIQTVAVRLKQDVEAHHAASMGFERG